MSFMFEDNLDNALKIANKGYKVYLFDKTYNQGLKHKNIIRLNSWRDFKIK